MDHPVSSKRRSFKIRTRFGTAREWRSRKNRPCDVCRQRKTACIIESHPPCKFCRSRGLNCRSSGEAPPRSQRMPVQDVARSSPDNHDPGLAVTPGLQTNVGSLTLPDLSPGIQSSLLATPQSTQWLIGEASPTPQHPVLDSGVTHTLEDVENRTTHNMGLAAEQDTDLLASFRAAIMNESDGVSADILQVKEGGTELTIPPVHFNLLHDEFQPADDLAKAQASQNIETMIAPHGPALVRLFFTHVHPVYSVVSKARFLQTYSTDKFSIPASLRGAIYGLGAMFWSQGSHLPETMPFDLHLLFEEAVSSLQREFHAPNLWKLQACLLLLHERPADNATIETPRTWIFSAQIVACAQMIGLHRDPQQWQIAPWEKHMRKKLWWATYAADIWSSICHGNPPHIYPASFTTAPPDMDDVSFDEDLSVGLQGMVDVSSRSIDISTCASFLEMTKLSQILHELIDTHYSDTCYGRAITQPGHREHQLLEIKTKLDTWESMTPHCVTMGYSREASSFRNNAPIRLAYFAVKALFFRALMSPATRAAKSDPDSTLCRYFDEAVGNFQAFAIFMNQISQRCLHAFWGGHARSQLTLCGNFLIYLFLLAPSPTQVHASFRLLESFHEALQRLREWADDDASLGLLRPVALRIDSFFTHAAQTMRSGMGPSPTGT
ncbi:hypothetical protein FE257_005915 [Aspergillus nanangensis]|uniref:Zn(2)-C6 fungal-type domain-containing protein n=1 Tax=Aspergillus nanangensis TaxID=2582783 RepID=A0AAD4CPU7_ASPNN|nr:hypothetical protein FE257_005915 [Aspergillus nanangensis]